MSDYSRGRDLDVQTVGFDEQGRPAVLSLGNPVSSTFAPNVETARDERLGEDTSDTVGTYDGESGTMTFRNDNHSYQEIMRRWRAAKAVRGKTPKYQIVRTLYSRESGTSSTLVYPDVIFTPSESAGGKNEAIEISMDWISGDAYEV